MEQLITFQTLPGQTLQGEKVTVPGFERLDFVYIQDGMMGRIFELATGMQVVESQGFTVKEAIAEVINAFRQKNLTDASFLEKFYRNSHQYGTVKIINESPAYLAYQSAKKAEEAAEPFYYSEADRSVIQELIDIMQLEKLPHVDIMVQKMNQRINKYMGRPPIIETVVEIFNRQRNQYYAMQIRAMGRVMPMVLRPFEDWQPTEVTWDNMISEMNYGRKQDITKHMPIDLLNEFALLWDMAHTKNNYYGYRRFAPHGWASLVRLAIDIKKDRDVTEDIKEIRQEIAAAFKAIEDETQPYQNLPSEIYI